MNTDSTRLGLLATVLVAGVLFEIDAVAVTHGDPP